MRKTEPHQVQPGPVTTTGPDAARSFSGCIMPAMASSGPGSERLNAQLLVDSVHHGGHLFGLSDIAGDGERPPATGNDLCGHFLQRLLMSGRDRHCSPGLRVRQRHLLADTAGGARHESVLAMQLKETHYVHCRSRPFPTAHGKRYRHG